MSETSTPDEGTSFISHLIELRTRLIRALISILVIFGILCVYPGTGAVYDFLAAPMMNTLPESHTMIATGVITPFIVPLKVTLLAAFVISLPFVLYQAWAFIAPGLYKHEKRLVLPLVVASTVLFFAGMAFCYFFVFHTVFHFIARVAPESITVAPDIEAYLGFVMTMFLAFGITFEVPVVVMVLVSMGLVSIKTLTSVRGYVIVCAFIIAAIVTPPDVLSQLMMAVPLCLLFELGVFFARFLQPKEAKEKSQEASKETE